MRVGKKEFTRREFLKLALCSMAYVAYESVGIKLASEKAKSLSIFHHIIHVPTLDKKWDKTVLIQFSDTHLSSRGVDLVNPEVMQQYITELSKYLKNIGALESKTILIDTGDIVSAHMGNDQPTPLADLEESLSYIGNLQAFARFSVEGNHEVSHPDTLQIAQLMGDYDFIRLGNLQQNSYLLDSQYLPFTLAALPDYTTRKKSWYASQFAQQFLEEVMQRDPTKPLVLATHTSIYDSWNEGVLDGVLTNSLLLHGHTHGGQIAGPIISPARYFAGRYAIYGDWTARKTKDGNYRLIKKGPLQESKYYKGIHKVSGGNIISISPGLGHSGLHGPRLVPPGAIIYEIRTS